MMDPLIITGIGIGIYKALELLVEKGITDPALDHGLEPFRKWLTKGYDEARDAEELERIFQAAFDELKNRIPVGNLDRLVVTLKLTGLNQNQYSALAAAAIEMVSYDPDSVSIDLLNKINLNESHRELLAKFLFLFRKHLADSPKYQVGIQYANEIDQHGQLAGLSEQILNLQEQTGKTNSYLELLIQSRRLSNDDSHVLKEYLDWARQRWGDLMLPLIRKRSGNTIQTQLKQIFVPLRMRDLAAEERAKQKITSLKDKRKSKDEEQIHPIELGDLLNTHTRFILIGSPGCGKTTLLRRIAFAFAEGRAAEDLGWKGSQPMLPIFTRLRNFGAFLSLHLAEYPAPCPGALVAFLENQYQEGERHECSPKFFDQRLQEGNCLVLLDGLDEVSENRSEVAQYLREFINHYGQQPGNYFGLSSRPRGYESVQWQLGAAKLAIAEVLPLEVEGIKQLIKNLFSLIETDTKQRKKDSDGLSQSILSSKDLTEIASTPLFCSALVQVYKYHGAHLPERRVDVLDEIVDLMLGFWRAQQVVADAERFAVEDGTGKQRRLEDAVSIKRQRLSYLAYRMQENHLVDVDSATAVDWIAKYLKERERIREDETALQWAEVFLVNSHEHSGLLAEMDPGKYSFTHKAFMEFMAATWLVNRNEVIPTALVHIDDDWWESVILLAGAHPRLSEGFRSDLINELLDHFEAELSDDLKAAFLLIAGKLSVDMAETLPGPEHDRTEHALLSALTGTVLSAKARAAAGNTLARLGDPRFRADFWYLPDEPLLGFVHIPAGKFLMGSDKAQDPQADEDELPQHEVEVGDYYLARYPVTVEQFKMFVDASGYNKVDMEALNGVANHPVRFVTWHAAIAYCNWLTGQLKNREDTPPELLERLQQGWRITLPSEAEWERAARGTGGQIYPWKGEFDSNKANTEASGIGGTSSVGCFPGGASPDGLLDMSGNVWEWTRSHWKGYPYPPPGKERMKRESLNAGDDARRVLRGGAWLNDRWIVRCVSRLSLNPNFVWNIGFRVGLCPASAFSVS